MGVGKIIEIIVIVLINGVMDAWGEKVMLKKNLLYGLILPTSSFMFMLLSLFAPTLLCGSRGNIFVLQIISLMFLFGFLSSLICLIMHLVRRQNSGEKE